MRKIGLYPILIFVFFLITAVVFASVLVLVLRNAAWIQESELATVLLWGLAFYLGALFLYRFFLFFFPLEEGEIPPGSRLELIYHIYILFYLVLFYSLIRSKLIPVPYQRIIYLALGAELGKNTYCSGTILDPILTVVGENTIIGEDSLLFSHAIEGDKLCHEKICIGDQVTIGAKSIIMSGVEVGDRSIVAAGSVVLKNTRIEANQIWGGNPAKFIRHI